MTRRIGWRRLAAAGSLAALVALAACGGGDDGGSGGVAPAPAPTTLTITAGNMATVASLSTGWAEAVLWFGELAVDYAGRFRHSAAEQTHTCTNVGLLVLRLVDRDANARLSAGDAVVAEFRNCAVPLVGGVMVGTLTAEVTASVDSPRSMRGTVSLGPAGVSALFGSGPSATYVVLKGSLAFESAASDVATTLATRSTAADDFSIAGNNGTRDVTERLREFDIAKTLQYDEARAKTRMQLRYESEVLGGTTTVTTPQPLLAYLDTYPEQGQIVVRDSGGRAVYLTPNAVSNLEAVTVGLDSNGDTRVEENVAMPWLNVSLGYLWWNGRGTAPMPYKTLSYSTIVFTYDTLGYWKEIGVKDTIGVQFSRPPVNPPALRFRLRDQGTSGAPYDPLRRDVDIDTSFQGALLLLRPRTPLLHGRRYAIEASTDGGATWPRTGVPVRDALGNTVTFDGNGAFSTAATMRNTIVANATLLADANAVLRLDGSGSTSERPIASYRWRQLGGTPLAIATPDAATTELRWGPTPPTGLEAIALELTVTDSAGEPETSQFVVSAFNATASGSGPLLYFRSSPGDYLGGGQTFIGASNTGSFSPLSANSGTVSLAYTDPTTRGSWMLQLDTADGAPLQVGAYENAVSTWAHDNANGVAFSGFGRTCSTVAGRFDVLEIATDASGTITRMAVDFEQRCNTATAPPLYGSFRFNSALPLRF